MTGGYLSADYNSILQFILRQKSLNRAPGNESDIGTEAVARASPDGSQSSVGSGRNGASIIRLGRRAPGLSPVLGVAADDPRRLLQLAVRCPDRGRPIGAGRLHLVSHEPRDCCDNRECNRNAKSTHQLSRWRPNRERGTLRHESLQRAGCPKGISIAVICLT